MVSTAGLRKAMLRMENETCLRCSAIFNVMSNSGGVYVDYEATPALYARRSTKVRRSSFVDVGLYCSASAKMLRVDK